MFNNFWQSLEQTFIYISILFAYTCSMILVVFIICLCVLIATAPITIPASLLYLLLM
jgi:hypothetical protein